jgi:hypothetical protein
MDPWATSINMGRIRLAPAYGAPDCPVCNGQCLVPRLVHPMNRLLSGKLNAPWLKFTGLSGEPTANDHLWQRRLPPASETSEGQNRSEVRSHASAPRTACRAPSHPGNVSCAEATTHARPHTCVRAGLPPGHPRSHGILCTYSHVALCVAGFVQWPATTCLGRAGARTFFAPGPLIFAEIARL